MLLEGSVKAKDVIYIGGHSNSYDFEMLRHVLSYQVDKNYSINSFSGYIPKQRAFSNLANSEGIDVVYGGATIAREELNQPIRIPLLKGLNGWRIPLVKKQNANLIAQQKTLDDFKQLLVGQFHLWSDAAILKSNNLRLHKATYARGLYQMLDKGRFDYFPLSVLEVWAEMEKHKNLDIMIEQHTLLHYPTAYYFYVSYQNHELFNAINQGLEMAIKDGSFDRLYYKHFGEEINKVRQTPRKIYELSNPHLPTETPLHRKELWIDLRIGSN